MPDVIQTNPKVLGGQPVIKGTRIPIARIVALFIQGYKIKDFKQDYPYLDLTKKTKYWVQVDCVDEAGNMLAKEIIIAKLLEVLKKNFDLSLVLTTENPKGSKT